MPGLVSVQCQFINLIMVLNWVSKLIHDVKMVFSWLTNCMVNELSISYETLLASSHFSREPLVLGSNSFLKTLRTFWFWFKDFKFFDRTSSPVLHLVLYISRPPLPGSFLKKMIRRFGSKPDLVLPTYT